MPAIETHNAFALEELKNYPTLYQKAFLLGSQGPDPFFFYGTLPWRKRSYTSEIQEFGSLIHHSDLTDIYGAMMLYAEHSSDKDLLFTYIQGLFLHYALDRRCHPYIFAKAGFSSLPKEKAHYAFSHMSLEAVIDRLVAKKKSCFTHHPGKILRINKSELQKISLMWSSANEVTFHYPHFDSSTFMASVKDYASVLRFTNDIPFLKRWFLRTFIGKESSAYATNYPYFLPKKWHTVDFLNVERQPWPDCVSGEIHTESFSDLWDMAHADVALSQSILKMAEEGKDPRDSLREFVHRIDHDGFDYDSEMTHMAVIWPK